MAGGVDVEDIRRLRRDLNKIDKQLAKNLRVEFLVIGKQIADGARSEVPTKSGRAAQSIRAGMSGNTPYVAGGKKSVPYYGWLDFGSREPKSGRARTVGPWKGSGSGPKRGRFLLAYVYRNRKRINDRAAAAMDRARRESMTGG